MTTFVPRPDAAPMDADVTISEQTVITPWGAPVLVPRGTALLPHGNYVVPVPVGLLTRWFTDRAETQRAEAEQDAEAKAGEPPAWYMNLSMDLGKEPTKPDLVDYARKNGGIALNMAMSKPDMIETIERHNSRKRG